MSGLLQPNLETAVEVQNFGNVQETKESKNAILSAQQYNTNQQSDAMTFNNMHFEPNFVSNTSEQNKILKNFLTFSNVNQGNNLVEGFASKDYNSQKSGMIQNQGLRSMKSGQLSDHLKNYNSDTDKTLSTAIESKSNFDQNIDLNIQKAKKRQSEQIQSFSKLPNCQLPEENSSV